MVSIRITQHDDDDEQTQSGWIQSWENRLLPTVAASSYVIDGLKDSGTRQRLHPSPTPPPYPGIPHRIRKVVMIPTEVSETISIAMLPRFAERSVESSVHFSDSRRHKSEVTFEPCLAPVKFADTMIVFGHNSTRKRYVSRTFYEPRVKPKRFAETDFVYPKEKTERFASFLDYHIDECRKWFKTCMELKARTFTTVAAIPSSTSQTSDVTRNDVTGALVNDGPGASQVFIPPQKGEGQKLEEMNFRVSLKKEKVDINMNGPISNGFF